MADYQQIYTTQSEAYDRMVSAEDCEGQLAAFIGEFSGGGALAVDVGCGTGRVSRLLLDSGVGAVIGVEPAAAMLETAQRRLGTRATFLLGDALALPVESGIADRVVAGWVFGHFTSWHADSWQTRLAQALAEFERVSTPGAQHLVIETLGTGAAEPGPPNARLADYYRRLEQVHGFTRTVVQTDYLFSDPQTAADAVRFFFGAELADRLIAEKRRRVPEWTGIWAR